MDVEAIGPVSDFSLVETAARVPQAVDQERQVAAEHKTRSPEAAANVATSPTYSPHLYAQAAQTQIYTQTGALSALAGTAPAAARHDNAHADDIKPVEGSGATHVDTKA